MDQSVNMKVIKEPLDVKQEEAGDMSCFDAGLDCVGHAKDHISGCVIVPGAKLV